MNQTETIARLQALGWQIETDAGASFSLPEALQARYPALPAALVDFLAGLRCCVDSAKTAWFLCEADYHGRSDSAFRWNEWESLSIELAHDDAATAVIREFWDQHFPFMLSVQDGYAFHALCLAPEHHGEIVCGRAPEFEEVTLVATSFELFMQQFLLGPESLAAAPLMENQ